MSDTTLFIWLNLSADAPTSVLALARFGSQVLPVLLVVLSCACSAWATP